MLEQEYDMGRWRVIECRNRHHRALLAVATVVAAACDKREKATIDGHIPPGRIVSSESKIGLWAGLRREIASALLASFVLSSWGSSSLRRTQAVSCE